MVTINQIADYIILKLNFGGETVINIKLQKLLYYVQAWYLAFYNERLFPERFQAWVHGPVSRTIYNRFAPAKSLYSEIYLKDVTPGFELNSLDPKIRQHIESVLEAYTPFSGSELESMTHRETPWIAARSGYSPSERCEVEIDEELMGSYYRQRIK